MAVAYRKNKNTELFRDLQTHVGVTSAQNFIPLYTRIFELNATNWNRVNLEHAWELQSIESRSSKIYTATVRSATATRSVEVFFKMSPLIDPSKYLTGSYEEYDFTLPTLDKAPHPKMGDVNNVAYIDAFFNYLTSRMLHEHGFSHGVDFYGSFLGIKTNFIYTVEDDAQFCMQHSFFKSNKDKLFSLNIDLPEKQKIEIGEDVDIEVEEVVVDSYQPCAKVDDVVCVELPSSLKLKGHSQCSSASSNTDRDAESYSDSDSLDSGQILEATIFKFPVQVIALEACKETLDSLLDHMTAPEMTSALMQIIMMLITYQKVYKFTHNDLHTNNVMYLPTTDEFLYYYVNGTSYKVPTYGKIYKLIDFGRAIYSYGANRFVSDSFSPHGDAATQYNIEPYLDPGKPVLDANYSFDLCRLACSLIDCIPEEETYKPLFDLVESWCLDDKGRNVLYKQNGEERYPYFKLYKMIARTVHKHVPLTQLKREIFQQYVVKKKSIKGLKIMNIDEMPEL